MWYDYLFPKGVKCLICGKECSGLSICEDCYSKLPFIVDHCAMCGGEKYGELEFCDDCVGREHKYDKSHCILHYDGIVRDLILSLKNNRAENIAEPFAEIMLQEYNRLGWPIDIIIPVPIHENRRKVRGYNQSELLSSKLAELGKVDNGVLVRVKDTPHQTGLNRANREENLHSAFKVMDKEKVKGKIILLVDDIYTTGSTLDECARTLKKAGAKEVYALCLSRTPIIKSGLEEEY